MPLAKASILAGAINTRGKLWVFVAAPFFDHETVSAGRWKDTVDKTIDELNRHGLPKVIGKAMSFRVLMRQNIF